MYETGIRNFAELRGVLAGAPVFSHESRGEKFFTFPIETRRLSGTTDRLNIVARASLLSSAELCEASRIHVTGELRSFNNKRGDGAKLVVTVFGRRGRPESCGTVRNPVQASESSYDPHGARYLRPDAGGGTALRPLRLSALHLLGDTGPRSRPLAGWG